MTHRFASHPVMGVVLALAAAGLFATNGTVSKLVMGAGLSSLQLVSLRSAGASACLFALVALTRPATLKARPRELGFLFLFGITGIALVQWLYFVAIFRLQVGIALLLQFTAPVLVALWVRFVRHQPAGSRVWAALSLCVAGLILITQVWEGFQLDRVGVIAGLGAALALAAYYLLSEHGLSRRDGMSLSAWTFGFSALLWAVVQPWWTFPYDRLGQGVALPGLLDGLTSPLWILALWVVLLGTVMPFLFVLRAIRILGAPRTGLIGMIEPASAALVAWLVLGEILAPIQLLGAAVVLAGIILAETARVRPARDAPAPVPEGVVA